MEIRGEEDDLLPHTAVHVHAIATVMSWWRHAKRAMGPIKRTMGELVQKNPTTIPRTGRSDIGRDAKARSYDDSRAFLTSSRRRSWPSGKTGDVWLCLTSRCVLIGKNEKTSGQWWGEVCLRSSTRGKSRCVRCGEGPSRSNASDELWRNGKATAMLIGEPIVATDGDVLQ
jgi:hypothetical protein